MTNDEWTFDPESAPEHDHTSLEWAMWTFVDRTGARNLSPAQVRARLRTHQRTVDGRVYQRPLAAAAEYITRPDQMVERIRNDLSEKYVDPLKVAAEWKALQAQLDTEIPAPAGTGDSAGGDGTFTGDLTFRGWG